MNAIQSKGSWFWRPRPVASPRVRLICIPYAGGSAAAFRNWPARLPADVEMLAVQLPGRGARIGEPLLRRLDRVVEEIGAAIPDARVPTVLFGHSMGGLTAFMLCRWLRAQGRPLPSHLIVSGRRAPQHGESEPPAHMLPDAALIAKLRRYGGTPDVLLREPELMELMLPIIRADFEVIASFRHVPEAPLGIPVVALAGQQDTTAPPRVVEGWREHTSADFSLHLFPGSHFFVHSDEPAVLSLVSRILAEVTVPSLSA